MKLKLSEGSRCTAKSTKPFLLKVNASGNSSLRVASEQEYAMFHFTAANIKIVAIYRHISRTSSGNSSQKQERNSGTAATPFEIEYMFHILYIKFVWSLLISTA